VRFGAGTVADVGAVSVPHGRRVLLVTDEHLADAGPVRATARSLAAAGAVVRRLVVPVGEPAPSVVDRLVSDLRGGGSDVVVAVGGGSVLDVAKVAVAVRRDPAVAAVVRSLPDRTVVELTGRRTGRGPGLVLVPTTHGTGAECSGVASLRAGDRKHLLVGPALWADVAVVDPELGAGLPPAALRAGALETWCRAFSIFAAPPVPGTTPGVVDAYAVAAGAAAVAAASEVADDEPVAPGVHLELAAAASTTALGWTSLGRDPHGARLWQAQNELSALCDLPKSTALPSLVAAYVAVGVQRDSTLGTASRIERFVDATLPGGGPAGHRTTAWLETLGGPASASGLSVATDAEVLRDRIAEAWEAAGADPATTGADAGRLLGAAGIGPVGPD
jgi:NADP-dependent alcohol dehydrogenase